MRISARGLLLAGAVLLESCATTSPAPFPSPEVADLSPLEVRDQQLLWDHARSGLTPAVSTRRSGGVRVQCCYMMGVVENHFSEFAGPGRQTPETVAVNLQIAWIAESQVPGIRYYCSPGGGMSFDGGTSGAVFMFVDTPMSLDWGAGRVTLPPAHESLGARFGDRWRPIGGDVVAALAEAARIDGSIEVDRKPSPIRFRIEADSIRRLKELLQYTSDD